jgi:hypothetical protein
LITLVELIVLYLVAIFIGKNSQRPRLGTYVIIAVVALAQVGLVLLQMFNVQPPKLK